MFIRSANNYDTDVQSFRSGVDFSDSKSRTQQHMRDECDINVMVQRFAKIGMPPPPPVAPTASEFDEVFDFQSAMNVLVEGNKAFSSLSAKVRQRFGNDPHQFLSFIHDENNRDEAIALGLVPKLTPSPIVSPEPSGEVSGDSANNP